MNNIIECRLDSTCKEIYTGIWQHDYGQILGITGANLPKAVEIQFSLKDKGGDTLTRIGTTVDGATEVKVPDSLLKNENCTQNYLIYAWIYVTNDTSGNTEHQIILHVKSRQLKIMVRAFRIRIKNGESIEEIAEDYPALTTDDLEAIKEELEK